MRDKRYLSYDLGSWMRTKFYSTIAVHQNVSIFMREDTWHNINKSQTKNI